MALKEISFLLGGLGLFLFGMKMMSEGLERVAGARLRAILEMFTKNKFIGMLVGLLFTAAVQSSSVTTVMVVNFVNSGLMPLFQTAGVILGANIGTTVTGQLIAFNLSDIAPFFVIIGVVMFIFSKSENIKKVGSVILGFGILFMGLGIMSDSIVILKKSPYIFGMLETLKDPAGAVFLGLVITVILQSSSATVGLVILMAEQGLLSLPICFYLILGCNIGSCTPAMLASINCKKDAKRAAWLHLLFNLIGMVIMFAVFRVAMEPIEKSLMKISGGNIGRVVANAHSLIKIFEALLLFPFTKWIIKAAHLIVRGSDPSPEDQYRLLYIRNHSQVSPTTAVIDVIHELEHMGKLAIDNLKKGIDALCTLNMEEVNDVYEQEDYIDYLDRTITKYLVKVNGMQIPMADALLLGGLFHVTNDLERVSDHAVNFADSARARVVHDISFTDTATQQLREMTDIVVKTLEYALDIFGNRNQQHMAEVIALEDEVDEMERELQQSHVSRISKGICSAEAGMIFSDTISGLERVADHATNIAFAIMEPQNVNKKEAEDGV